MRECDYNPDAYKPVSSPITLDFGNCRTVMDIHQVIKDGFGFPDYYGRNLDALWDLLYGAFEEEPTQVFLIGIEKMPKEFNGYMEKILEVFEEARQNSKTLSFKRLP